MFHRKTIAFFCLFVTLTIVESVNDASTTPSHTVDSPTTTKPATTLTPEQGTGILVRREKIMIRLSGLLTDS